MIEPLDLDAIGSEFLQQCGSCDFGLVEYGCQCPKRDHRPDMLRLVREVERLREQVEHAAKLRNLAAEMLSQFREKGHPGEPCLRTGWVREATVVEWHQTLREAQ